MKKATPFVLIADDFGITEGVSQAIIELLKERRISGTSAICTRPDWRKLAFHLAKFHKQREIGLHLNLTVGGPLSFMPGLAPTKKFPSLPVLIFKSLTGQICGREICKEIRYQITEFANAIGELPTFIDGHQHVHALPIIRDALFDSIKMISPEWRPWLRNPAETSSAIITRGEAVRKSLVISTLSYGLKPLADAQGFPTNDSFSGVTDFNLKRNLSDAFTNYLKRPGRQHLVMCHPGFSGDQLRMIDPVVEMRDFEFEFLMSAEFSRVLERMNMRVAKFSECN